MPPTENGQRFLSRVREYLLSLPFDLKVLQEILTNDELPQPIREQAAGVLLQAFCHQEGTGPERFLDDILLLRLTLGHIATVEGEAAASFRQRFDDIFGAGSSSNPTSRTYRCMWTNELR